MRSRSSRPAARRPDGTCAAAMRCMRSQIAVFASGVMAALAAFALYRFVATRRSGTVESPHVIDDVTPPSAAELAARPQEEASSSGLGLASERADWEPISQRW